MQLVHCGRTINLVVDVVVLGINPIRSSDDLTVRNPVHRLDHEPWRDISCYIRLAAWYRANQHLPRTLRGGLDRNHIKSQGSRRNRGLRPVGRLGTAKGRSHKADHEGPSYDRKARGGQRKLCEQRQPGRRHNSILAQRLGFLETGRRRVNPPLEITRPPIIRCYVHLACRVAEAPPRPKALLLMSTDTGVQRIVLRPGKCSNPARARDVGPRFSEFPRLPARRCGPALLLQSRGQRFSEFRAVESKGADEQTPEEPRMAVEWLVAFLPSARCVQAFRSRGTQPLEPGNSRATGGDPSAGSLRNRRRRDRSPPPEICAESHAAAVFSMPMIPSTMTKCAGTAPLILRMIQLLGAKEVAHWLGFSRAWVFGHLNGRRRPFLPSVKLRKSVRYRPVDVDAFIIGREWLSRRAA